MRNELEDLKQQAKEVAKEELKKKAKEAAVRVLKQILSVILPVLPYIIIGFILFIVIVGCFDWEAIGASAISQDLQSASSSSLEQFLRYVATKEGGTRTADGLNYIVENDGAGYPTVGHGLCLKSSDGYLNVEAFSSYGIDSKDLADRWLAGESNLTVPVEICDAIWEEGVRTRYESIVAEYPDLTTYQHYALTDVKYRRGNTNGFQEAYNSKWSSSDDRYGEYVEAEESFSTDTLYSFFWDGGHSLEGVNIRKKDQWVLFKYGYYRVLNEYYIARPQNSDTYNSDFYGGIEIYNNDGSVNVERMEQLDEYITNMLNTVHHDDNNLRETGPFPKWWKSPINNLEAFQCTWWANGRASQYLELTGSIYSQYPVRADGLYGDGGQWYRRNIENGWFNYGTTPKKNSVISWSNGDWGHVAYVEAYDPETGDIWVSHAGGGDSWYGVQRLTRSGGYTYSSSARLNGFIYLDEPLN